MSTTTASDKSLDEVIRDLKGGCNRTICFRWLQPDDLLQVDSRAVLLRCMPAIQTKWSSSQMRRCIELRILEGRSYREIASAMGISINTVKAHLHQAKKLLKDNLNGSSRAQGS